MARSERLTGAIAVVAAVTVATPAAAQAPASLAGTWRGTSICTAAGKPACHDEIVVYRVAHDSAARDVDSSGAGGERQSWSASKVVNGREEEMGVLACVQRGDEARCPMRGWLWHFQAAGDTLTGTLASPAGVTWRHVRVVRDAATHG